MHRNSCSQNSFQDKKGLGELAKINILLDHHYTAYLPIWIWVIEHRQGSILIDTCEVAGISDLDKFLAKESGFVK